MDLLEGEDRIIILKKSIAPHQHEWRGVLHIAIGAV